MAEPVRTCLGCRRTDEQRRLVRMVADAAGRVRIDPLRRRPGRGAYVHSDKKCVAEMVQRGALGRSLKRKIESLSDGEMWLRIEHEAQSKSGQGNR